MGILDSYYARLKKLCGGDDMCVLFVCGLVGVLLYLAFKKDGFSIGSPLEHGDVDQDLKDQLELSDDYTFGHYVPHTVQQLDDHHEEEGHLGLDPKPNRGESPPDSLREEMEVLGGVHVPEAGHLQEPGQLIQDGSIVAPFSEVWNPGYEPIDLAFKGAVALDHGEPVEQKVATSDYGAPGGVSSGSVSITLYYAPWCPHCKAMMPDWEEFKNEYGDKFKITDVNSDEEEKLVQDAGVDGFPTIKVNGEVAENFPRDLKGMKDYVKNL